MSSKRVGKFTVPRRELDREGSHRVFSLLQFVPMRAEMMAWNMTVDYMGVSPKFDEVMAGGQVPDYTISCIENEVGEIIEVEVERI